MALSDQVEFLETLGEGSFGLVCLARLVEGPLKRTVVLKILKEAWADDERVLTRARDEAHLLALINHDNIVKVERLETVGRKTIVVMEYVQGVSLDLLLEHHGALPVGVALQIAGRVASALDAAFNRVPTGERRPLRVVHRDIKPSNIIVSVTGGVKVLDFGTARGSWESREARTETHGNIGTLLYMSPEAFDGNPGPEVDVYALGSTLYELLTGVRLGRLSVRPAVHESQRAERLARLTPAELLDHPEALAALRRLVGRCLSYEPADRPSAAELKHMLRGMLDLLPAPPMPLDLFAELQVEPLWRTRPRQPPPALDSTLERVGSVRTELDIHPDAATRAAFAPGPGPVAAEPPRPEATFLLDALPPAPARPGALLPALALALLLGLGITLGARLTLQRLEGAGPGGRVEAPRPPPPAAPVPEAPAAEDPAAEDPAAEDPAAEDPAAEDPAAEDPAAEDPAAEDPVPATPVPATPRAATPVAPPLRLAVITVPAGLELRVDGGAPLKGQRDEARLSPGWHGARLTTPEGEVVSCRFELRPGQERLIARLSDGALRCEGR